MFPPAAYLAPWDLRHGFRFCAMVDGLVCNADGTSGISDRTTYYDGLFAKSADGVEGAVVAAVVTPTALAVGSVTGFAVEKHNNMIECVYALEGSMKTACNRRDELREADMRLDAKKKGKDDWVMLS